LKSFQKGSICENLSQKGPKIKKVGTVALDPAWPAHLACHISESGKMYRFPNIAGL
jgi:prophage DNA circulation protein